MSSAGMGRSWIWICGGVVLSLTGCAHIDPGAKAGQTAPATVSKPPAAALPSAPAAARSTPVPRKPAKRAAAPARPPVPAPSPADVTPPPPSLQPIGLNEEALQKLLGQPSTIRDETPAKVLSFRRSECALNLTLYPDVETRTFRTLSYEVTSDDHDKRTARLCKARFGIFDDTGVGVAARR